MTNNEYPANKRYSQAEFVKMAASLGWDVVKSRGKGSHYMAFKAGEPSFTIPSKISIGVDHKIKKTLGLK